MTSDVPAADQVIDAQGKIVCRDFWIFICNEDPVESDGKIYSDDEKTSQL